MTNKLFIGGLSYNATEQMLGDHFAQIGTVLSAKIITDRDTGRSKGFGFVEMATPEEAQIAMDKLDKSTIDNRPIFVKEALPQVDRRNDNSRNFGRRDFNKPKRW